MNHSKINQAFLAAYIELDRTCAEKLDTRTGVTEYINTLTDMRYAAGREDVLPTLIKYRKLRNRIAHEPGAMKNMDNLSRDDISWVKKFEKDVKRGKDPISKYLKKASGESNRRALVRTLILAGVALAVIAVIVLLIILL